MRRRESRSRCRRDAVSGRKFHGVATSVPRATDLAYFKGRATVRVRSASGATTSSFLLFVMKISTEKSDSRGTLNTADLTS